MVSGTGAGMTVARWLMSDFLLLRGIAVVISSSSNSTGKTGSAFDRLDLGITASFLFIDI